MARLALLTILAVTASIGCGSTDTSTNVAPSSAKCAVDATPTPSAFPASGGSGSLVVASGRECSWSVSSPAAWITLVPPTSGQGDGTVRYTVPPNPAARPRLATLVLGSESAEISQAAAACRLDVDHRTFDVGAVQETASVNVQGPSGCAWTARAAVPWIVIVEGARGEGNGRVRFHVSANDATEARVGSLDVAGVSINVRQRGGAAPAPAPPPCSYGISPDNVDTGPEHADGRVSVKTGVGCSWTAVSDQAWLTVVAGASATDSGDVQYQAAANGTPSTRTGHITINGSVFTLRQTPCSYAIDKQSESFVARGGSGPIDVKTQSPCAWSAHTTSAWIQITSAASAVGNGRVEYQVQPNTNIAPRTGTISVANLVFTLRQDGETSLSGLLRSVEGSCPGKRFSLNGQHIRTTSSTHYEDGSCGDVKDGARVILKGLVGLDGVLTAIEVDF